MSLKFSSSTWLVFQCVHIIAILCPNNNLGTMKISPVLSLIVSAALADSALAFVGGGVRSSSLNTKNTATTTTATTTSLNAALNLKLGSKAEGLLINNRYAVDKLRELVPSDMDLSDIALLRFALAFPDEQEAEAALQNAIEWRQTTGKHIVETAAAAVAKATENGGWDNDVVRDAAPHADIVNKYMTLDAAITTSTEDGDLVYVVRPSAIADKELMDAASFEQVCEYFMYAKEVHNLVANARTEQTGRMTTLIFANDISGVRKPPDSRLSKVFTSSSDQYEVLYPSLAGPTMILNLPFVLQAFVALLKPFFPKSVQERLVFKKAKMLAGTKGDLSPLASDPVKKANFVKEITSLLP